MKEVILTANKPPKDEHDIGYKSLFSKKETFMHFLRKYVGANWVDEINEDDLILMDKSFILKDYKDKEADIIYRAKLKGKEIIFYVLLELQSKVDYTIAFRLLLYITELLRREFDNADKKKRMTKGYRLPVVIPIIIYNGKNRWSAVRSFKEYLLNYELFGNNVIDFEYLLLDLNRSSEDFILTTNKLIDNVFALDQKHKAEDINRILNIVIRRFRDMKPHEQTEFMRWFKQIMLPRVPESNRDNIFEGIERGEEIMLKYGWDIAFENERKEGRKEGKEEGIKEGIKKNQIEIAENCLKKGLTVELIVQITNLSIEEVMEIKTRLKL